jgi:hypothetical protein
MFINTNPGDEQEETQVPTETAEETVTDTAE